MKKFLLLAMLLAMVSLNVLAAIPTISTNGSVKLPMMQGYFSRVDTFATEFTNNRFKFVENQTIPSITIGSEE